LPLMIRQIIDSGIRTDKIVVLVATGLHRPNLGDELRAVVGDDWVLKTVRVENHYARNDLDHGYLATTSRGTPVRIDKRFVEAHLRIVTGLVEPHFMAGYSGGRKLIAPGMAHYQTITRIHSAEFAGESWSRELRAQRESSARGPDRDYAQCRRGLCAQYRDR